MHLLIYLPLAIPLLAALAARPLAERLPPRTATWLLTGSAVALAGASCAVLGLLALAAAVRIPLVDSVGGMSLRAVDRGDPAVALPLGVLAGALLGAAVLAALRAGWLRTLALVTAHRQTRRLAGARRLPGTRNAVIVADDGVDAYTVPGWPSQIVVTSGMLAALSPAEREVMLAHERAHATACHYLFMAAARLAAAANPLLSPLAGAIGYSVERWADEQAATAAGSRPLTARTIAKAALAASAAPARRESAAVLLGVLPGQALGPSAGLVPRRVAALLAPPPRRQLALVAMAVALVAVSCVSTVTAASDLHGLIEFAQAAAIS
ncbi:MAG TPA: M56 family metallopeptidase [Streptosporangiaceae bacterium]|jgi:Zn-dependent protease with chaperone function